MQLRCIFMHFPLKPCCFLTGVRTRNLIKSYFWGPTRIPMSWSEPNGGLQKGNVSKVVSTCFCKLFFNHLKSGGNLYYFLTYHEPPRSRGSQSSGRGVGRSCCTACCFGGFRGVCPVSTKVRFCRIFWEQCDKNYTNKTTACEFGACGMLQL